MQAGNLAFYVLRFTLADGCVRTDPEGYKPSPAVCCLDGLRMPSTAPQLAQARTEIPIDSLGLNMNACAIKSNDRKNVLSGMPNLPNTLDSQRNYGVRCPLFLAHLSPDNYPPIFHQLKNFLTSSTRR